MDTDEFLKIIACPACHGPLIQEQTAGTASGFLCEQCQLVYPIHNDIPVLLVDRAIPVSSWREGGKNL